MKTPKTILVSPLDWGLGHSTRLIFIIDFLINKNYRVLIGGSGSSLKYLENYYPELESVHIPSARIKYGKKSAIGFAFSPSLFRFIKGIVREHIALSKIIKKYDIDIVISDNRLGLYSSKLKTIYITHQLNVFTGNQTKVSDRIVSTFHKYFFNKFDVCLIPDNNGEHSLSGDLSNVAINKKLFHIGPISRFYKQERNVRAEITNDILVLISGPEPQRTLFENIIVEKLSAINMKSVVVRGQIAGKTNKEYQKENIQFFNSPSDEQMFNLINESRLIICRSGYSTLMDLAVLKRKAILVSTPGQPEQEYLAKYFTQKFGFKNIAQSDFHNLNLEEEGFTDDWNYDTNIESVEKALNLHL